MTAPNEQDEPQVPGVADVPEPDQEPHEPVPDEAGEGAPPPVEPPVEDDQADGEGEDEGEPQSADAPPATEKELRAIEDKLKREDERHAGRIADILAEAAQDLIQCPLCTTVAAGWLYPPNLAPVPEEAAAGVRILLGMPDTSQLEMDPDLELCPRCKGKGNLATPSLVDGYGSRQCGTCKGVGYKPRAQTQVNGGGQLEAVPAAAVPDEPVYATGDPQVDALRQRGFTVIPPPPTAV